MPGYTETSTNDTLVKISDVEFYEHPYTSTNSTTDYKGWVEDGVLAISQFKLKTLVFLNKLTIQILAQAISRTEASSYQKITTTLTRPNFMIHCPLNNYLFISRDSGLASMSMVDCSTNLAISTTISTIDTGDITNYKNICYNNINNKIYVARNTGRGFVDVVDPISFIIIKTISIGSSTDACLIEGLIFSQVSNRVYISVSFNGLNILNQPLDFFGVIDCSNNSLIAGYNTGGNFAMCYNSKKDTIYIDQNSTNIHEFNCSTNTITTINLGSSLTIIDMIYNLNNDVVYMAVGSNIRIFDCATNSLSSTTISIGSTLTQICLNETDNLLYASASSGIYIIDCEIDEVIETISSSNIGANTLAYNPIDNTVYANFMSQNAVYCLTKESTAAGEEKEFVLEEKILDVSVNPFSSGVQPVDIEETRDYHLVDADERNIISLQRDSANDETNYYAYELKYPFKLRWEDWRTLLGVDTDFPLNNHDWQQYSKNANWDTKFRLLWEVDYNRFPTIFQRDCDIGIKDYSDASEDDVFTVAITTFSTDESKNFGGKISLTENTLVKALFTGNFATMPTNRTTFYGILAIDNGVVGGVQYTRICSTETDRELDSPWLGLPTDSDKARMTINGTSSVLVEAVLDYTKLDKTLASYFITGRLGLKA